MEDCPIPIYSCKDETPIYKENVFACDTGDMPIKYKPYSKSMESMFAKNCKSKQPPQFFYPENAECFFGKNDPNFSDVHVNCGNTQYYNTAWNQEHYKGHPELLSDSCHGFDKFFNNTGGKVFPNECMKKKLTEVDPYVSAYDCRINHVTCEELPTKLSFRDSTAI